MSKSNVTITIPPDLAKEAALLAARRGTTVSGLVASLLQDAIAQSKNGPLTVAELLIELAEADPKRKSARRSKGGS